MKAKDFEKLGVDEETAKKLEEASLEELKGYIPKSRFDEVNEAKKKLEDDLKTQVEELEKLKESVKESAGDTDKLRGQIEQLQTDLKNQQTESVNMAKTYALKEELAKAGVLDADYIIYKAGGLDKFNFDKENKPVGVEDSLKPYKEDTSMNHLFKQKSPYNPSSGSGGNITNPFAKETFNLTEQGRLLRSNPEQARSMAAAAGVTL